MSTAAGRSMPAVRTRKTRGRSGKTHVIPYQALGDPAVRTLIAVMSMRRPTVRSVAQRINRSPDATHVQLVQLRAHGAITDSAGLHGAIRARVRPEPTFATPKQPTERHPRNTRSQT